MFSGVRLIVGKLKEFNGKVDADHQVAQADIAQLEALLGSATPTAPQFELLWKLLQWPTGKALVCYSGTVVSSMLHSVCSVERH